jgi:fructokinase
VIAVFGEALIDLVMNADGQVDAHLGGGPYNTARALARLGATVTFLGRLGGDSFGRLLREGLVTEGVSIGLSEPSAAPSTLAVADLDQAGVPSFRFYLTGTAAADADYPALRAALPSDVIAVHVGTLGLVMEPVGAAIERLVLTDVPPSALVMLDPNCRPGAVLDQEAYLRRVEAIARRADIVKASVADLAFLYPDKSPGQAAAALLALGAAVVLVTAGPHPARAFLPDTVLAANVPKVDVVDTIGAGDAFGAAFLAWWTARGLARSDLRWPAMVSDALRTAAAVAALACARPGADPPTLTEVRSGDWWPEPVV